MIRAGLALWVLLAAGSPSRAQAVYLQPQQRGISASLQATHTPRTSRRDGSEPLTTSGVGLTLTVHPRAELAVQLARQRGDRYGDNLGLVTVLATGWLVNSEAAKLGLFAGFTSRDEQSDSDQVATVGLGLAHTYRVSPRVSVVPQFVASVAPGLEPVAFVVGATPAIQFDADGFGLFVEPSVGYEFGTRSSTVGVALGLFGAF